MDSSFFCQWFKGFENGLEKMDPDSRSALLRSCAVRCADTGVLQSYLALYRRVNGDRDEFYRRLCETGNVRGEIAVPHREYYVCFPECGCNLHTECGVNTPALCECSRQSILYVAENVWKDCKVRVEQTETVLSGDRECRFHVIFDDKE